METLVFLLKICLVSSVLVAASSSGLDLLPPLSSPPSPLPESSSKGFGQAPISPPESHNTSSSNAPPPQPSSPPIADVAAPPPSLPPIADVVDPPPSGGPVASVPNAPAPATIPVKDLPGKSPPVLPVITPVASPPRDAPKEPGRVSPGPVSSPVSDIPPLPSVPLPPPIPIVVPPKNDSNSHKQKPIAPVASPPTISIDISPPVHPVIPKLPSSSPVPTSSPTKGSPIRNSPVTHPVFPIESPAVSPDHPPPSDNGDENKNPVAAPSNEAAKPLPVFPHKASPPPSIAPSAPKFNGNSHHVSPPSTTPPPDSTPTNVHRSASPPPPSSHRHHQGRNKITISPAPSPPPTHLISPRKPKRNGSVSSPLPSPHHARSSLISPAHPPITSSMDHISIAPAPSPTQVFPLRSSSRPSKSRKFPLAPPLQAFPPPPPNSDCSSTVCLEPYTNTPPGSPCGCVWPIQVELRLSMALYDFFPMVSEFAREVSAGVFMKQSQVRIMGANAASEQPDKSIVLVDLVPLGDKFDNMTAMLTYQRFWSKKVQIFCQYDVVYVRYPGLPASPPVSGMTVIDQGPYPGDNNGRAMKPLGVDVPKKMRKKELNGETIAVIVLSAAAFIGLCFVIVWFLLFRRRRDQRLSKRATLAQPSLPSLAKPSGSTRSLTGSRLSSTSLSFASSIAPFTLSAKTFTASEIVKATNNFAESRVLGEGGFGRVYEGLFDDGTKVAVKVLKRDDQQGGREFLAEVEMLSRLHHRNLVNLIGICIEDRNRSLVYELIPNGSVESHLHGVDKEASPLDWDARLKIALGAARGLAYLHEDSSPRVIHRDFKSSNILLEHDFTPKVSDFGLARNALDDEDNRHISTRVMGTFGYVAPEYAMTGHLLVKSDVYSYGVVLLELLTGRKPVDMTQPPGQENLVSWTRSLLTSREGLEAIIDQSLGQPEIPFDSIAKVAAIASMCVQPEVSHRPFMGEVVQALKLVCNECDEAKELNSVASLTQDENRAESSCGGEGSGRMARYPLLPSYDSEPDTEKGLSVSEMFTGSGRLERQSNSGPLASGRGKRFWQKMRRLSTGSLSEHGSASLMLRSGSR
ncbi:Protein kinase superfamily protein [Raphanus sativus]|uniref:Receptor-like serine/threonine-protein kinase ALE2 isoform X1 n=1 Tax=Raphanus sativus TaxID=3726 RepID=A0A6J0L9B3_RAPSA|nr:receptor-like serine/threonine-protein kinase ALE2 isoform X1 [Raphanus sativus]KAJ4875346.1 Protein kinase superfamily protein [Raphanus sativus]